MKAENSYRIRRLKNIEDKIKTPDDVYDQNDKVKSTSTLNKVNTSAATAATDPNKTAENLRDASNEKNVFPAQPPPPLETEEAAAPIEEAMVIPVARSGPQFLNGLDIYDNVAIKEMESRVYEEIIKTVSQDIVGRH